MAYQTFTDGPYFSSGSISFSQLYSTFGGPTSNISASAYLRDTTVTTAERTFPRVPDATENANIPSTKSNVSLSRYRNSIKEYYVVQSGTDINANFTSQPNWNGNLGRNIPKFMIVNGVCGSSSTGAYGATFSATMYNMYIFVYGVILGAGGLPNSGGGGPAFFVASSGNVATIVPTADSAIYGGGGAGARGFNGNSGAPGTCFYYTYYNTGNNCGGCPGCGGDAQLACYPNGGCNCSKKGCSSTLYYSFCRRTIYYGVPGAPGGTGGNGGRGRGYNWQAPNSLAGSGGTAGTTGGCPSYGGSGDGGQTGGAGGDWGAAGETVYRYGLVSYAGEPGRGVAGGNYSVDNGALGGSESRILGGY